MRSSTTKFLRFNSTAFLLAFLLIGCAPQVNQDWSSTYHEQYDFSFEHPKYDTTYLFDDWGHKGDLTLKAEIIINLFDPTIISFYLQESSDSTLENVIDWGEEKTYHQRSAASRRGIFDYEEIEVKAEYIREKNVTRKRYRLGSLVYDNVYINRSNDMMIVSLKTPPDKYQEYNFIFDRVVQSLTPLD